MCKVRKIGRMVALTKMLTDAPGQLFSLSQFHALFGAAKSTLSEDLAVIRETLRQFGLGTLETVAGAGGGVQFAPLRSPEEIGRLLASLARRLAEPDRLIPGGFLYMTDLLFDPALAAQIGEAFRTRLAHLTPDCVMTVETKGIPLALMTARAFGLPLTVARQGGKVTEGPSVGINYVSGSSKRIQTMSLPRRMVSAGSKVLIIDDFMKAGGTAKGMMELVREVGAEVAGVGVLVATAQPEEKMVDEYIALLTLHQVDEARRAIDIRPADALQIKLPYGRNGEEFVEREIRL